MQYCGRSRGFDAEDGAGRLQFLNRDVSEYNVIDRGQGIIEISNGQQSCFVSNDEVVQFADQLFLIDDLIGGTIECVKPVLFNPDRLRIETADESKVWPVMNSAGR